MRLGFQIIAAVVFLAAIVAVGAVLFLEPVTVETNQLPEPVEEHGGVTPLLVQGAGCEQDSDCSYAINAYPKLKCVSENCPPVENPNQPEQGDPAYEWEQSYDPACLNVAQLNNQNSDGDELQIDTREASCVCKPIESQDGIITSVTGSKVCTIKG